MAWEQTEKVRKSLNISKKVKRREKANNGTPQDAGKANMRVVEKVWTVVGSTRYGSGVVAKGVSKKGSMEGTEKKLVMIRWKNPVERTSRQKREMAAEPGTGM